jgi:hypothetical protein
MIVRNFYSTNKTLKFALEEIYKQFEEDIFINEYDFILFAISTKYLPCDINRDIKKIFKTDKYLAFNAINSFSNTKIVEGISACFISFEKNTKIEVFANEELNEKETIEYLNKNKNSLNILITTYDLDIVKFFENLDIPENISLIGGIVSEEIIDNIKRGFIYLNNKCIKKGFAIISFKNVKFASSTITGYRPLGPFLEAKLVKDNKVYLIDYNDASLIAKNLLKGLDDIKDLWNAPLLIKRENLLIPRTFKDIKENFYVEFFGNFRNRDKIQISFASKELLLKEDKKEAKKIKREIKNCDLVFNFSCIARQYILDNKAQEELAILSETINAPLFGFFTFGEIINTFTKEKITLYNQTSLVVGVSEC